MKRRYSSLALSLLALGGVALTATEASAMMKDPDRGSTRCTYPEDPACNVPPLETVAATSTPPSTEFEGAQLGASALGGAGVAFGCMWLYRRRHPLAD